MLGLKYISWGDTTGYAIAAKAYVRALLDAGVNLTWTPMMTGKNLYEAQTQTTWPCPKLATVCNKPMDYDTVLIHTVPEYYPQWIERERREGRHIFGSTVWELEQLPSHWPAILNQLDGVIVPCHWNVEVFQRSGVTVPIHVVPHLSQFEDLPPTTEHDRQALQTRLGGAAALHDRFIFYTVGFWSHRKAPYLAIEAYLKAFGADDPVLMVIKTNAKDITRWHRNWRKGFRRSHPPPGEAVAAMAAKFRGSAPLALIADDSLSDAEMLALHEMGDCFVSLARAEGWGLGAFEAARLGKPVVMTGYGGQLDFLDPKLSSLVDYTMVPVCEPSWSANYKSTDYWAEPSVSQAASHLRHIFENQSSTRDRARLLAERIACKFPRETVIRALLAVLE